MRDNLLFILVAFCIAACTADVQPGTAGLTELDAPAGPGSMTPHLHTSEDGTLVLSWLEPSDGGMALRYATFDDHRWGSPVTVASGDDWFVNWADFPSVVKISDDYWAAHWLQRSAPGTHAYDVRITMSRDGLDWSDGIVPHRDKTATEHGFVSLDRFGDEIVAVWLDGRNMTAHSDGAMTLRWASLDRDARITADGEIDATTCECCQTDLAAVSDGMVVVYRDRTESEIRDISAARISASGSGPTSLVSNDGWQITGCPVNGPAIAARSDKLAVAWFSAAGGAPVVKSAFSDDGGTSFSESIVLAADSTLGRVDIVWLSADSALVSWIEKAGDGAEIRMREFSRDGSLGKPVTISPTSASLQSGFPQLAATDRDIVVAWTEVGDTTRVRTARIAISAFR